MEAAGPLEGLTAQISPANDFVAVAYADGRLKTFDTARGALCVSTAASETSSLLPGKGQAQSSPVTCLTWLQQAQQGQRLQGSSSIVLGHANGGLSAVDAATGETRWTATDCHSGAVGAVAAAPSGQSVHSAGADSQLRTSSTQNGAVEHVFPAGKGGVTALGLSPDGATALLGGDSLSLWRLHPAKRLQKLTGHPAPVRSIAFAPGGRFAASAAQGERNIVLWDLGGPKGKKQDGKRPKRAAAGLLSADEPAHALVTGAAETTGDFLVAAIMQSGRLNVWSCHQDDKQRLQGTHLAASKPASGTVLAVQFTSTTQLLVAHGSPAKPTMQHVSFPSTAATGVRELELTAQEVALVTTTPSKKKSKAGAAVPAAVGPEPMATTPAHAQGVTPAATSKRKRGQDEEPAQPNGTAAAEDPSEDESEDDVMDGPTFQERLAAAGLAEQERDDEGHTGSLLPKGSAAVQAGSLATVLSQALQAQDSLLLERCLKVTKASVVTKTVQGLAPAAALQLLSASADRLQSKPTRGQSMYTWLRPLLLHHAAYLMSAPGAQPALAKLYRTIEVQVSHQAALSSLAGRLDLLCAQIPAASGAQDVVYQPQVVYDESLEVEDALNPTAVESDADDLEDLSGAEDDDEDLSDA